MREDVGGCGKTVAVVRWLATEAWAAVGVKKVKIGLVLFCKWSQQDFLVLGGVRKGRGVKAEGRMELSSAVSDVRVWVEFRFATLNKLYACHPSIQEVETRGLLRFDATV